MSLLRIIAMMLLCSGAYGKEYVFGMKVITTEGLSLEISYGEGKLMYINLNDCISCNNLELDIGNDLKDLSGRYTYPTIKGIRVWRNSEEISYQTTQKTITIDGEILIKVPKKLEGCK